MSENQNDVRSFLNFSPGSNSSKNKMKEVDDLEKLIQNILGIGGMIKILCPVFPLSNGFEKIFHFTKVLAAQVGLGLEINPHKIVSIVAAPKHVIISFCGANLKVLLGNSIIFANVHSWLLRLPSNVKEMEPIVLRLSCSAQVTLCHCVVGLIFKSEM